MRQLGDLVTDLLVGLLQRQVGDALAGGHGRRHQARLQLEHVLDQVVFGIGQHTGLGAGVHHGRDVVEGEFVGALGGQPEQRNQFVRQRVEDPHQRLEHHDAAMQRTYQPAGQFFGGQHGQPLRQQVGKQHEQAGHGQERQGGGQGLQPGAVVDGFDQVAEAGAQRRFTHGTGQDGHGVDADLHGGDELAGA